MTVLMPRSLRKLRNASVSYPLSATSSVMPGIKLTQVSATTQSAVLPGVSTNTHGRHSSSTTAWILLFRPPLVRPIACVSAPLFRRWRSGGFSHDCCRVPPAQVYQARPRPRSHEILPDAPLAPACKTIVDRLMRPVLTRTIFPATA